MMNMRHFQRSRAGAYFPVALLTAALCAGQSGAPEEKIPNPPASKVFSNPRAGSDDPRVGLKAGLYDAGEAAFGLEKVVSLPKPPGFATGNFIATPNPEPPPPDNPARPPSVSYGATNSDIAFSANHLFVGNYKGINFYDIDNPSQTKLRTSLMCPGGQGDVSVYGHLLFMSAEAINGRTDCGTQGVPLPAGYTPPPPPPPAPPAAEGVEPERREDAGGRGAPAGIGSDTKTAGDCPSLTGLAGASPKSIPSPRSRLGLREDAGVLKGSSR
jgi:hypothetical protein